MQGVSGSQGSPSPRGCTLLAPSVGDKVALFYTGTPVSVSKIWAACDAGTITFDVAGGSALGSAATYTTLSGTVATTTPTAQTGPYSISGFVWVEIKAITGSPGALHLTMEY